MAKLEDEIKQYKFPSQFQKALLNLIYTGNWIAARHKKFFAEHNLSHEQYNVLRILRGQHPNPASIQLINERMLDKMSNVSRLVEKLRAKSLITRTVSSEDRRQVDVKISDKGLSLLAEMDVEIDKLQTSIQTISESEAEHLNQLLDKLRG
ncbi:MarR family transcriptional regulator [Hyphobacterium sp. CCMP332]|nr:MarR family transcriptional regulator [Hyphobacterium sp. CCMP332]